MLWAIQAILRPYFEFFGQLIFILILLYTNLVILQIYTRLLNTHSTF